MTWSCDAKANWNQTGRVEIPVQALMTGTPDRTAQAFAVRRGLKEVEGKLLARATRIACEVLD